MTNLLNKNHVNDSKNTTFEHEFMPHLKALYNFAFKLTREEEEAKDLVQDTYMKAYRFMHSFQKGTNAKAWLFKILKNSFINEYRKKNKVPSHVDYKEIENYYDAKNVDKKIIIDLRSEMIQNKIGDEITHAINSLAVDFRIAIILCDLEGFTYEEMAKILDIPIGTVRSRLHRARNILKEKLCGYATRMGYSV